MRGIIFALTFTLVGNQHYDPSFSKSKTYIYQYEGIVLTGLPEHGLAKGGLQITSKVQINSIGQKIHLLKMISPRIEEYSGVWPRAQFIPARKLTEKLAAQLNKPIKFEYSHGRVGNIYAQPELSENILNIYRGILNMLQISIKKSQNIYELQENGVEGICQASYVIQENKKSGVAMVTKSKDLNNCQEKISETKGSAYTQLCETCQQKGRNLRSVSTYSYAIKGTEDGAVIIEVVSKETHQFTPFNELDGAARAESRQHLVLLESKNQSPAAPTEHLERRGTLKYQLSNELQQLPIQLAKPSHNDSSKIAATLENLARINQERAHPDAPQKFLQLIQLLRSASLESLQNIWGKSIPQPHQRRWILDTLPTVATPEAIQFVQTRIEQGELSQFEATQALIFTLHSIKADCHGVDNATVLLSSPYMQRNPTLRRVTLLAYGSLVQKYCTTLRVCPDEALQPLHELVVEAGSKGHEEEIILGLKAIGNAGQPASLKRIQKLLPGFGNVASSVSGRIHAEAMMALRNIAKKEPRKVQALTLQLFMNRKIHAELRMRAFIVLLETKPSLALIATMTDSLIRETNLQLVSFSYSYMKSLAGSSLLHLQSLAASCNIAIKRLNEKCDTLSYRYSKGLHVGTFNDQLLAGFEANIYFMKKSEGILPTSAIANIKVKGLGVSTDFLEIGYMHSKKVPSLDVLKIKVPGWKPIPTKKALAVAYIKLFGQELAFVELDQNNIQEGIKLLSNQGRMDNLVKKLVNQLQRGITTQWTKPLLATEIRHIVPTSLGLPMELAFYYTIVSAVTAQAKVKFNPAPSNFTMVQLLNTTIQTDVQITPSSVKDVIAIMGINTPLIQTGVEVQLKTSTVLPVNFTARVNLRKSNVKIESPPLKQEDELFSARSRAFAFSRNIEDLSSAKVTPLLLSGEFRMMYRELNLAKNSTADKQRVMEKVLPLAIPQGSVCSAEDTPDVPIPTVRQACAKFSTFGVQVCYKTSSENAAFTSNSPLYRIIGDKSIVVTVKPVITPTMIKKLQVELQLQSGEQLMARVSQLMRTSNMSNTDLSETTMPEGKLALLKLKKNAHGNVQHRDRKNERYSMRFSSTSSQTSDRRSTGTTRKAHEHKKEHTTNQRRTLTTPRNVNTRPQVHHKHNKHNTHHEHKRNGQPERTGALPSTEENDEHYRNPQLGASQQRSHQATSSISSSSQSMEEHGSHHQHRRLRPTSHQSTSSISSSSQSMEEPGSHHQHRRLRPISHQSTSSSSSSARSKERDGAHPRERSLRESSSLPLSSSSSSDMSRHKKGVTQPAHHHAETIEKCKDGNCNTKQLQKPAHRPTVRKSPLSSSESHTQSSSFSSSAKLDSKYNRSSERTSSSSSSSSGSSSRRLPKHWRSKHSRRQQSSSSLRTSSSSSSMSWHQRTRPSTKRGTITKVCKNGKCIHEYIKARSTTIHKLKTDHRTWIFNSESGQEEPNANILQLRFEPHGYSSQKKDQLSFESSSKSSSGSSASFSSSSSSSSSSQQSLFLGDSVPPIFSLLIRAITINDKERGYETKAYVDNSMDQRALQLFVDEIQEGGNWRVCIDAEMPNIHRALASLKWGKNCQDYKIAAKASTGHFERHPAMLVKAQWDVIPQSLKQAADSLADQIAAIAFMFGFFERHQRSHTHRISVIAAATSQRTLDVVVRTPKHIFSRRNLLIPVPLPFDVNSPSVQQRGLLVLADLPAMVLPTATAECRVLQNQFTPFSKECFEYEMPEGCAHVLVQDCTPELKFIVLIRRSAESLFVQLNLPSSQVEIQSTEAGNIQLFINGTKTPARRLSLPGSLVISRNDTVLKIKAPEVGLEHLLFDGKEIRVSVTPSMAESTCGLCGQTDSQRRNEYQQPNKRSTREILKFAHSWLLPGESCKDACKLMKQTMKMENSVDIHGQESKCYTVDPVLHCQVGCSPVQTVPVVYGFHCLPADSQANPSDEQLISTNFGQKSEDLIGAVEAHTACSCSADCR
ncbi:vitellogenin 3, phosvitinless [Stegostoma tigrinum]|uniref:vitellogenin 3, phosvitinless n=1 Tax=Stegostoma tigrinum TaxID=3053191 RepID=UPI0028703561|nr:vitellogenin 3, phosvitinless [Stegostoma tigrinum]